MVAVLETGFLFQNSKTRFCTVVCLQTVLKTKTSENENTKKQKSGNNLYMFPKTVFGVFI
jgi:hypothetical protein